MFAADHDFVEEHSFQFETKSAVKIDIAHVDVTRVDVNLIQVPDHEGIIEKGECRALSDAFALQAGFAYKLFHLQFAGRRVDILAPDNSHRLIAIVDAEIFACRVAEILFQLAFSFRKRRHEAFAHCSVFQPTGNLFYDRHFQRTKSDRFNDEPFPAGPFILHRRKGKDSVIVWLFLGGPLFLGQEIIEQVRSDPDNLCLANAIVHELVIEALRNEPEHLIALPFAGNLLVVLLFHLQRFLDFVRNDK